MGRDNFYMGKRESRFLNEKRKEEEEAEVCCAGERSVWKRREETCV